MRLFKTSPCLPGHVVVVFFARRIAVVFFKRPVFFKTAPIFFFPAMVIFVLGIAVLRFPFGLTAIKLLIIEVWHQVGFHVADHFVQRCDKAVEIFLVKKDFMAFVAIPIFPARAFRNGNEIIIATGFAHVEEIGAALAGTNAFGKNTFFRFAFKTLAAALPETTAAAAIVHAAIPETSTVPVVAAISETAAAAAVVAAAASESAAAAAVIAAAVAVVAAASFKIPVFHLSRI